MTCSPADRLVRLPDSCLLCANHKGSRAAGILGVGVRVNSALQSEGGTWRSPCVGPGSNS